MKFNLLLILLCYMEYQQLLSINKITQNFHISSPPVLLEMLLMGEKTDFFFSFEFERVQGSW